MLCNGLSYVITAMIASLNPCNYFFFPPDNRRFHSESQNAAIKMQKRSSRLRGRWRRNWLVKAQVDKECKAVQFSKDLRIFSRNKRATISSELWDDTCLIWNGYLLPAGAGCVSKMVIPKTGCGSKGISKRNVTTSQVQYTLSG